MKSGETRWDKPEGRVVPAVLSPQIDMLGGPDDQDHDEHDDDSTDYEWEGFWNEEHNRWYYVSAAGETVWGKPADVSILLHDKDESFASEPNNLSVNTSLDNSGQDVVTISTPKLPSPKTPTTPTSSKSPRRLSLLASLTKIRRASTTASLTSTLQATSVSR